MRSVVQQILKKEFKQGVFIKELVLGAANTIFLCDSEIGKVVIKFNLNGKEDLESEFFNMNYIGGFGFNMMPKAISVGIIRNKQYLIQEFVEGKTLVEGKLTDYQIVSLAKFYKTLHGLRTIKTCGSLKKHKKKNYPLISTNKYADYVLSNYNNCLSKSEFESYLSLVSLAKSKIIKFTSLFASGQKYVLTHGDGNPLNFIQSTKGLVGIDWVWSAYKPVTRELADMFNKMHFTSKNQELFLMHYGKLNKRKLNAMLICSYLGTATWSLERLIEIKSSSLDKKLYSSKAKEFRLFRNQVRKLNQILSV